LLVDTASAVRRLDPDEFARWAATHTVFLSSEMRALGALRAVVAAALRQAGFSVVMFEDLGGRDEDAERAYLDGVARSDIYVGIVGDRYGTMLPSGRSPTHEEYLEARRRGKRISVWLQRDGSQRQGHASDFAQEVQAFHTTGQFADADDLARRLLRRLSEISADDEAPWVKTGDVCLRASRIRDEGSVIVIAAEVRDPAIVHALEALRPDGLHRDAAVPVVTARRAGRGRVTAVVTETKTASAHAVELSAEVSWADDQGDSMEATFSGFSPDDQTEIGLRAGLLGEPMPPRLEGNFGFMIDTSDPSSGARRAHAAAVCRGRSRAPARRGAPPRRPSRVATRPLRAWTVPPRRSPRRTRVHRAAAVRQPGARRAAHRGRPPLTLSSHMPRSRSVAGGTYDRVCRRITMSEPFEPIEIVGVDTPNVGTPRNDGTRGSGLYRVPIKLSRRPPREWAAALAPAWDRPPEFTTMHRPGIATVNGDCVVLEGTTIDEVRDYHARTLALVVAKLNEDQARYEAKTQADAQRVADQRSIHQENVHSIADEIRFE